MALRRKTQTEFVESARLDKERLCFCDQLSEVAKAHGFSCGWCRRYELVLDGTIKNIGEYVEEQESK